MNFEDEDYVRYYTRDTVSWRALGWEGQTVMALMLHGKFDRSGVFDCDSHEPADAIQLVTGLPIEIVNVGLERLLKSGTWIANDGKLIWTKFVHAQSCRRSDRLRQKESREKRRDDLLPNQADLPGVVTSSHNQSQDVTPSLAYPSLAEPNLDPPKPPGDDVRRVFDFWKKEHNHPKAIFDEKRQRRIKARFKEGFSVHDLCLAIRGAKKDTFLMGVKPDSVGKYDGIETLLRDAAQVERLIALAGLKRDTTGKAFTQDPEEAAKKSAEHLSAVERNRQKQLAKLHASTENASVNSVEALKLALKQVAK